MLSHSSYSAYTEVSFSGLPFLLPIWSTNRILKYTMHVSPFTAVVACWSKLRNNIHVGHLLPVIVYVMRCFLKVQK